MSKLPSKTKNENTSAENKSNDLNEKLMKIISYKNIEQNELQEHLNLIKKWLKEYNQFEYDNQSIGKFTKYIKKVEEIKIVLNHKLNFCRTKLFIDYLELKIKCPSFANEFRINFIQYISYINALVRRILISSKKILEDTSVFNDLILFNYPYNYSYNNSSNNYYELLKSSRGIISFSKCFVVKVNSPIFFLWAKKEYPSCSCDCDSENKNKFNTTKKYFNLYTQNLKYNSNFSKPSICRKCGKSFYHDTKGDIFIQSQEIKLAIDCDNSLLPNVISAWAFGDLINSVQEGDCITLNAFHMPEKINVFEKNYSNGYFVALNYDKFFDNLCLLRPGDFKLNLNNAENNLAEKLKKIKIKENNNYNFDDCIFSGENEEKINEDNLEQLLQSLKFQRQTCESFYKLIIQNYISFKQKELNHLDSGWNNNVNNMPILSPKINEIHYPFINIILDLSIIQRDYYNHHLKLCFFDNFSEIKGTNGNITEEKENDENNEDNQDSENEENCLKDITQSRNILFKKNIYNKNDLKKNNKIFDYNNKKRVNTYISERSDKTEISGIKSTLDIDIKNYFELSHQINNVSTLSNDLLTKPFNLFLIFDSVKNDPLFNNIIMKYATKLYSSLINIFPIHNQIKWTQGDLMNYFYSHNNSIILIQDIELLTKTEIDTIGNIMNFNGNNSLNITFWFCCRCSLFYENNTINKKNKKSAGGYIANNLNLSFKIKIKGFDDIIEKCEIMMNYSIRNLKFSNNINIIDENSIINFLMDSNEGDIKEEKILEYYHYSEFINNNLNIYCNKTHIYPNYDNSSVNASKIIEKYFIEKRNISKINFDDLFTLLRLSIFISMMRFHYENKKIILPITICNITYIDSLYAILIYEHISQYKYGLENKILGNTTESLIFQDNNQIINEIMNNIVIQEHNKNSDENTMNFYGKKSKKLFNKDCFNLDNEGIPSKSLNGKQIKLSNNIFDCKNNNDSIFSNNVFDNYCKKNKESECKLCCQINKLNVEHKKYLIEFLNKLNGILLKDYNE